MAEILMVSVEMDIILSIKANPVLQQNRYRAIHRHTQTHTHEQTQRDRATDSETNSDTFIIDEFTSTQ